MRPANWDMVANSRILHVYSTDKGVFIRECDISAHPRGTSSSVQITSCWKLLLLMFIFCVCLFIIYFKPKIVSISLASHLKMFAVLCEVWNISTDNRAHEEHHFAKSSKQNSRLTARNVPFLVATSHTDKLTETSGLRQCWHRFSFPHGVTKPQSFREVLFHLYVLIRASLD